MVDVITLDVEKIYRIMRQNEMPPAVIELFITQHEEMRTLQNAISAYAKQTEAVIEAMALMNKGFQKYATRMQALEKNFADPYKDMVEHSDTKDN